MTGPVVITGASGFLGRHLAMALLAQEREVVAVTRNRARLSDLASRGLRIAEADYADAGSVAKQVPRGSTLVHLAALRNAPGAGREALFVANVTSTASVARAAIQCGVERFIHIGTALVLTAPERDDPYTHSRRRGLRALEQMGSDLPLITVHPSIIYGPDWSGARNRLTEHVRRLLKYPWRIGIGSTAPRNLVFVDDVVGAILNAEQIEITGGQYLVSGVDATQEEFEQAVFRAAGRPPTKRITIPAVAARVAASVADSLLRSEAGCGWRARVEALLSRWTLEDTRRDGLGVTPTPLDVGLARTVHAVSVQAQ